ncbi:hypothetical protein KAR91_80860 [Candidatus Pacearchaeota archaeon]|nr:hypothetical protein [Candidatus Pacearchaeota archaeon]
MITVNTLSGGKTSSYIAANYPADYNVFALVRTSDKNCLYPDAKMRQRVSDKLGTEFIGTLEDDVIINTMFDLEQYIGTEINWVTGQTFDEVIASNGLLPSPLRRYCTSEMKMFPIMNWWYKTIGETCELRLGFRANEQNRAKRKLARTINGIESDKIIVGKHKNGNNRWKEYAWNKPVFPLIKDGIFKDDIENYWKDKSVRFAWMNNCVGCFNKNPILLKKMAEKHPDKLEWFASQERGRKRAWDKLRIDGSTYDKILAHPLQFELFDDDFNECDSGYCGL